MRTDRISFRKVVNYMLLGILGIAFIIGVLLFFGSAYTILNHYFYWRPSKIAAEFETSIIFATSYLIAAILIFFFFYLIRKIRSQVP